MDYKTQKIVLNEYKVTAEIKTTLITAEETLTSSTFYHSQEYYYFWIKSDVMLFGTYN